MGANKWKGLEVNIGYAFDDKDLLELALTHPSYALEHKESNGNNQRFEFLGDAVLSAIIAEYIFTNYPEEKEGYLARFRAILVRGDFLVELAIQLGLSSYILMSEAELRESGQERPSTLEDCLEALIGAIFKDSDYETAKGVILLWYGSIDARLKKCLAKDNPKGRLQEAAQERRPGSRIEYRVLQEFGPAHNRHFRIGVAVNGRLCGEGEGSSKKAAEEEAAREALKEF